MSFQNIYYQRTAATPRPCTICLRPTTTVLSTLHNVDFIYTCERHLSDPGFATKIADEPKSPSVKAPVDEELVKKGKEEWEELQRKKKEKEEKEEKDKETKDKDAKDGDKDKEKGKKKTESKPGPKSPAPPSSPPAPPALTHNRYALHRHLFAGRQLEHRKRRQAKEAKEIAPRLPGVPGGRPVF